MDLTSSQIPAIDCVVISTRLECNGLSFTCGEASYNHHEATRGMPVLTDRARVRLDSTRLSVVRHQVHVAPCQPMDGAHCTHPNPNSTRRRHIRHRPDHGMANFDRRR